MTKINIVFLINHLIGTILNVPLNSKNIQLSDEIDDDK